MAGDFDVAVGAAAALSRTLSGSGVSWELSIVVDSGSVNSMDCPFGYTQSTNGQWCGRVLRYETDWDTANAACAPYALASVLSSEQHEFVAGLQDWLFEPHWYVLCESQR